MDTPEAGGRDLELLDRGDYLEARFLVLGTFSTDRFKRQVEEASRVCRERKQSKLLGDLSRIEARLSTIERFELASHAVRESAGLRIALLVRPDFLDPDKFGIVVAQNRGLMVEAFLDRQKAIEWLLEEKRS